MKLTLNIKNIKQNKCHAHCSWLPCWPRPSLARRNTQPSHMLAHSAEVFFQQKIHRNHAVEHQQQHGIINNIFERKDEFMISQFDGIRTSENIDLLQKEGNTLDTPTERY